MTRSVVLLVLLVLGGCVAPAAVPEDAGTGQGDTGAAIDLSLIHI